MTDRRQDAYAVRLEAAEMARSREHETHKANGDEQRYAGAKYFMSFTKGLPHDPETGLLAEAQDFVEFRRAINDGFIDPFTERVRHGAKFKVDAGVVVPIPGTSIPDDFRQWEAPTAGIVFDLEGPDAQAVTMPPAPPLMNAAGQVNPELAFEMAEVYELAILRDVPLNDFEAGKSNSVISESLDRLNNLTYIQDYEEVCCKQFGRPRKLETVELTVVAEDAQNTEGESQQATERNAGSPEGESQDASNQLLKKQVEHLTAQTVFRGSSPGVEVGPYLSQFLLIGNTDINCGGGSVREGKITYGVLQIDQKVPIAQRGRNYMMEKDDYVSVQRGLKQKVEEYEVETGAANQICGAISPRPARRFISTPRDLATYVHYDALYEAYLNACLILLGMRTPFDPGFDQLSGGGAASINGQTRRNASGFALYGGPHILTLVTEVATRALKAVRYQKFNNHIRLRPEALAARLELVRSSSQFTTSKAPAVLTQEMKKLATALDNTLKAVEDIPGNRSKTHFLPMAFPEGSPMHPAYGAGHATVAGACVTILKAFFDTSTVLVKTKNGKGEDEVAFRPYKADDKGIIFRAPPITNEGQANKVCLDEEVFDLKTEPNSQACLTLEGELNKLAANISIGRNMAGVHYFTDYYDSLRMGEKIAIGMLEEQALTYPTDPFVLSLPTFDGDVIRIGAR